MPRSSYMLLVALLCGGCGARMTSLPLSHPVRDDAEGVQIETREVSVSRDVPGNLPASESRFAVGFRIEAGQATRVMLRRARLHVTGYDQTLALQPVASGYGSPPNPLHDEMALDDIWLAPGDSVSVWLAFGGLERIEPAQAEHALVLELPRSRATSLRLGIAQPAEGPLWRMAARRYSAALDLGVKLSADEGVIDLYKLGQERAAGPLIVGWAYGFGVHSASSEDGRDGMRCCHLSFDARVGWPAWRGGLLALVPFAGVSGVLIPPRHDTRRPLWLGPMLGLQIGLGPYQAVAAGPFPIVRESSMLSRANLRVALVHWFGPDRGVPSFGATFGLSYAYDVGP